MLASLLPRLPTALRRLPLQPVRWLRASALSCSETSPFTEEAPEDLLDANVSVTDAPEYDPTVERLVDEITQLNLLQTAELCELLQDKLGFGDIDLNSMALGGGGGGGAAAGGAAAAAEEPVEERTHFDVKLVSFPATAKIKAIKEVRGLTELGLKEAKALVESSPCVLAKELKKEDAEAFADALKAHGCEVTLE